jgi:hypothetical protein
MRFTIDEPTVRSAVPEENLDDAALIVSVAFENNAPYSRYSRFSPPLCVLPLDFIWFFLDLYAPLFAKRLAVSMYILYGYNNGMEWNGMESNEMKWNGMESESDSSADHSAYTWATGPSAADLAFRPDVSVWTADSHATTAAVTIVVGVERTGEAGGGSARVRVGELEGLHRRERSERTNEVSEFQRAFMILKEKIVLCYFREVRRWGRRRKYNISFAKYCIVLYLILFSGGATVTAAVAAAAFDGFAFGGFGAFFEGTTTPLTKYSLGIYFILN